MPWILPGVNKEKSPLITERLVAALPPPPLFKIVTAQPLTLALVTHSGKINLPPPGSAPGWPLLAATSKVEHQSLRQTSHHNHSCHFTLLIFSFAVHQETFCRRCVVDGYTLVDLSRSCIRKEFLCSELKVRGSTLVM